jgi:DNA-binding PadR family transcriptional regulator
MPSHHHHHHPHHHPHAPRGHHHDDGHGPGHGPHGHGPKHGGPGERHRRERMFGAGGLKLLALHLIAQQPSHGYDVIRAIGELAGGDYQPSPGAVYPTLSVLVDLGHATASDMEGGRKQYTITPEGQAALAEQQAPLQDLLARLERGKERDTHNRPAPLVRALENFKTALRLKLDGRPAAPAAALTPEQVAAIAAVLDEAALRIEQA